MSGFENVAAEDPDGGHAAEELVSVGFPDEPIQHNVYPDSEAEDEDDETLEDAEMEYDVQFHRLRDYAAELMLSNPDSSVCVETLKDAEGHDLFNRFYVCFYVLRKTWKTTCRPVIGVGVGGCFLNSKMKGQLLVAIGWDANNCIYPIAWSVVLVENNANWLWFVKRLKVDLGLESGAGFVLVSDRQQGLNVAVKLELPNIEHRMCARHICANLMKKHGKKPEMEKLVRDLAWSYTEAEYRRNLHCLRMYDSAVYDDVIRAYPNTWCRAFYNVGSRCEDVTCNFTEAYLASIGKARQRPLVPMLERIARQAMVKITNRFIKSAEHQGQCTPYASGVVAKLFPTATDCRVFKTTNNMFQIVHSSCSYQVSLDTWTCSCRKWDITGIPCEHGYAAILDRRYKVEDYVCQLFKTSMWRRNYTDGLVPARGESFWPTDQGPPINMPPAPPPTASRKRRVRQMHCSICGGSRNNSRSHKRNTFTASPASGEEASGSQTMDSQVVASRVSATPASQRSTSASQPSASIASKASLTQSSV